MPIEVRAVLPERFRAWAEEAKTKYAQAGDGGGAAAVAAAPAAAGGLRIAEAGAAAAAR
jgi:hypothetical protein